MYRLSFLHLHTHTWEQRKLEELFERFESRVETPHDGYWRLGLRSHCKGTFHTYVEPGSELETSDMNIVKEGNFILNITFAWELALAITDSDDDGKLVSHRFPQFKPKGNLLIKFFKHTLSNNKFKHHLQLASPGGAGRNKVLKINEMLKFELLFPNIEEQLAITKILEDFDNLITLHQRKYFPDFHSTR
jgi:putative type I restriction enzyme specificity protein